MKLKWSAIVFVTVVLAATAVQLTRPSQSVAVPMFWALVCGMVGCLTVVPLVARRNVIAAYGVLAVPVCAATSLVIWGPREESVAVTTSGEVVLKKEVGEWTEFIEKLKKLKAEKPNKAPEPTPGAVTPRATEGVSK